jgi:ABC-type lipoprotein export system ATPase subunit
MRIRNQMASQYQTAIIVVTHDEKIIPTFTGLKGLSKITEQCVACHMGYRVN